MNQELLENIKNIKDDDQVIVKVNPEIKDALGLILFQEDSLQLELNSVRENRYGFYDRDLVVKLMADIEDKRQERINFIRSIGVALLGDNYREILDTYGLEFKVDIALPIIIFFKPKL